jgi:hypothetical protein
MNVIETIVKSFFASKCDSTKFDEFVNGNQVYFYEALSILIFPGATYRYKTGRKRPSGSRNTCSSIRRQGDRFYEIRWSESEREPDRSQLSNIHAR